MNNMYEYKNKYYIKLYPSVYREVAITLDNDNAVINAVNQSNVEINDDKLLKEVSIVDIKNKLKNNSQKSKKYYKQRT